MTRYKCWFFFFAKINIGESLLFIHSLIFGSQSFFFGGGGCPFWRFLKPHFIYAYQSQTSLINLSQYFYFLYIILPQILYCVYFL